VAAGRTSGSVGRELPDEVWVSWEAFAEAAHGCAVPDGVRDALWHRLAGRPAAARLGLRSVAQHGGAALCLVAMGLFLGTSWASAGSGTGLALVLLYLAVLVVVCEVLLGRGHREAAGLLAATVVALVPLAVFAAQETFALWTSRSFGEYRSFFDYVSGQWAAMEVLTGVVGVAVWRRYRTAFLLLPVAVVGWFASMDLAAALGGRAGAPAVSAAVTAVLVATAVLLDARDLRGEAFWLHLAGLASLSWTLGSLHVPDGTRALLLGVSGAVAVAAGVHLQRRLHLGAGALGLFGSLSYLAFEVFGGSPAFALVLGALGVGIVVAGVRLDRAVSSPAASSPAAPSPA
jgi:hypothetical protein